VAHPRGRSLGHRRGLVSTRTPSIARNGQTDMKIAFVAGLSEKKLRQKLAPLQALDFVDRIDLYRRAPFVDKKIHWQEIPPWARRWTLSGDLYRLLSLLLGGRQYDLIIACHQEYHGVMAWIAGSLYRRPVVQMIIDEVDWVFANRLYRRAVLAANACAVRGGMSEQRIRDCGYAGPVTIIANPYQVPEGLPNDRQRADPRYDLICVAGLVEGKGHDWLLTELAAVAKSRPKVRLALAGVGPRQAALRRHVEDLGLTDNVAFLGWLDEPQLQAAYRSCKALVLSSWHEGLPMCVVEAMAVALPVIVTRVGELPWLVRDMVDGIVVTYKECGSLADGILKVLDSPEVASRMGRAARERIQELSMQWSTSSVAESWETLIAALSENTFVKRVSP